MKIYTNQDKINKFKKYGNYATFSSIAILGLGLYISVAHPENLSWAYMALILGFMLSQVGMFLSSKYGRSPRPDENITAALKGLDNKFSVYHHFTGVPHLLVGPAGIWSLLPFGQGGTITYDEKKNRWKQKGGNLYMKIFGQENLGRPDQEIRINQDNFRDYWEKSFKDTPMPVIKPALVFTSEKAIIDASNAPYPTVTIEKLKDLIRREMKEHPVPAEEYEAVKTLLSTQIKGEKE